MQADIKPGRGAEPALANKTLLPRPQTAAVWRPGLPQPGQSYIAEED
jgi:hypothetical protein